MLSRTTLNNTTHVIRTGEICDTKDIIETRWRLKWLRWFSAVDNSGKQRGTGVFETDECKRTSHVCGHGRVMGGF